MPVIHTAGHRIAARAQPGGIELYGRSRTDNLAAIGAPATGERIAIRIVGHGVDAHALAAQHGAALGRAGHRRRTVGLRLDFDVHAATGRAAAPVIHARVDGIRARRSAGGIPAYFGAAPVHAPAGCRPVVRQRVAIRVARLYTDRNHIAGIGVYRA